MGNGDLSMFILIICATCIEEDLEYPGGGYMARELFFVSARTNKRHHHLGGHVVAVEHSGEGLSLLGHAVSTPNVLAFSKRVLIVLEFFVDHALHEASQRFCVGSRATRAATGTA